MRVPAAFLVLVTTAGGSDGVPFLTRGQAPLDVGGRNVSAADCVDCHEETVAQWQTSRHAQSFSNALFQVALQKESLDRCVNCHAPLVEQRDSALSSEGVSCAACHVRNGEAHGNNPVLDENLCAQCHEFAFLEEHPLNRGQLSQGTVREWLESGSTRTCVDCHMPEGSHAFPGAHDVEMLQRALTVDVERLGDICVISLAATRVGHRVPTGDLFRRVDVELHGELHSELLTSLGRTLETTPHGPLVLADERLVPGEPWVLVAACQPGDDLVVRYHYATVRDALAANVVPVVVHRVTVR
ncbi:MAG: multiheme c-type cytochrome [Myxococcota bacterium]